MATEINYSGKGRVYLADTLRLLSVIKGHQGTQRQACLLLHILLPLTKELTLRPKKQSKNHRECCLLAGSWAGLFSVSFLIELGITFSGMNCTKIY